jgi:rubrerythrin
MRENTERTDVGPTPAEARAGEQGLGAEASRRRFMQLVGGAGAAVAVSTLVAACGGDDQPQQDTQDAGDPVQPNTDLEIANYALLLEYLEEDFYKQVVASGELRSEYQALAQQVRQNETEHVDALEALVQQLAGAPAPRPTPKFDAVIEAGEQSILETAATVENLGAAAYLGQATRVQNTRVLEAALAIHTVEARHAAALNEVAGNGFRGGGPLSGSVPNGAFGKPLTRDEVLEQAAPFIKV